MSHQITMQRTNQFTERLKSIAELYGMAFSQILPRAEHLSSADFCLGSPRNVDLPEVMVNELLSHYDLYHHGPFQMHSNPEPKDTVFIPNKLTEQLIDDMLIHEPFGTARRLYQYLNWTLRISAMAQTAVQMEGRGGCSVMLVDTELHDQRRRGLYALCIRNDIVSAKAQKWQLAAMLSGAALCELLGVDRECLPFGVRSASKQFEALRRMLQRNSTDKAMRKMKAWISRKDSRGKLIRYQQLKCVQTNGRQRMSGPKDVERALTLKLSDFYAMVRGAFDDDKVELIPIASIVVKKCRKKRKEDFSVDYLLPVQVGRHWVGVVFRGGAPIQALMDWHDVTNKAILCDPSFDTDRLDMFRSPRYNRLRIVADDRMLSAQSTPEPSPSPSASPSLSPSASALPMLINVASNSSMSSCTPTPSVVSTSLPPLCSVPSVSSISSMVPPTLPIPCTPFGAMSTGQLMQWMEQILLRGDHNLSYFRQHLAVKRGHSAPGNMANGGSYNLSASFCRNR